LLLALGGIDHCWFSSAAAAAAGWHYYAFGLLLPAAKLLSSLLPPTACKSLSPFYSLTRIWMFPSTKTALPNSSHRKGKKKTQSKSKAFWVPQEREATSLTAPGKKGSASF
jgi:hypothetical protein